LREKILIYKAFYWPKQKNFSAIDEKFMGFVLKKIKMAFTFIRDPV